MIIATLALAIMAQAASVPATTPEQDQANGQAAVAGMMEIFTVLGSCERHFTPEQVAGVRRGLEPEPGQTQTPLQSLIEGAYQTGKADTSKSAAFCQEVMRMLAEAKANEN